MDDSCGLLLIGVNMGAGKDRRDRAYRNQGHVLIYCGAKFKDIGWPGVLLDFSGGSTIEVLYPAGTDIAGIKSIRLLQIWYGQVVSQLIVFDD